MHASHHTGHEWVERRKRKRIVLEELVELQPDLKFIKPMEEVEVGSQSIQCNLQQVVVSTREPVFLEAAHKRREAKAS